MIIGIIAFCIQSKFIVLYADDLALGIEAKKGGLIYAFKYLCSNYMKWGGGPTPFIAIIFMKLGLNAWKIFNCLIILVMVILSVKLVTYNSKINRAIVALFIWCFIYILNIWISRETLYWLDGNLAYVLTTFQLLLYCYYIHLRFIRNTEIKKYDYVLLPIVAFFSGWTGPQVAVLTVLSGILLILFKKFVKREKISILLIITLIFAIIGCLVEVLAPGNSKRMEEFNEFYSYGILGKFLYRISSVYEVLFYKFELGNLTFFAFLSFGLISIIAYKMSENEKNKKIQYIIKISSVFVILFIFNAICVRYNLITGFFSELFKFTDLIVAYNSNNLKIEMIYPYIVASIVMIISCLLLIYISVKKKDNVTFATFVLALFAQGMMIAAPYQPDRATFTSILLLWISISGLIKFAYEEKIDINYIVIIVLFIAEKNYGIMASIIYFVLFSLFKEKDNKEIIILLIILTILAIYNWSIVTKNYSENSKIFYENISRIEEYIESDSQEPELKLLKLYDNTYSFGGFVGIDWVEDAVKAYYGLDKSVKLIEETELENENN